MGERWKTALSILRGRRVMGGGEVEDSFVHSEGPKGGGWGLLESLMFGRHILF